MCDNEVAYLQYFTDRVNPSAVSQDDAGAAEIIMRLQTAMEEIEALTELLEAEN
ncbi:MAG: hypothetical protein ACRC80_25505 [Waterburya sp.]